jgi:apolipoprotein N-acyltransferase
MRDRLTPVAIGALSGLLAALAYPPGHQAWLSFFAPVPLFFRLHATGGRRPGWLFFWFGVVHFSVGLFWLAPVVTPLGPLLLTILFVWPAGHTLGLLLRGGVPLLVAAPFTWMAWDFIRSFLFTGFPWLFLGYTLADWPWLVQVADLVGVYGVTGVIVLVGAGVAGVAIRRRSGRTLAVSIRPLLPGVAALFLMVAYGQARPAMIETAAGPRVLIVQANIPQYEKLEAWARGPDAPSIAEQILDRHLAVMRAGLAAHPETEVVIWPETMFPWKILEGFRPDQRRHQGEAGAALAEVARLAGGRPVLLGTKYVDAQNRQFNSVLFLDAAGAVTARYDKLHAVPGGEYIPLKDLAPASLVSWVTEVIEKGAGWVPDLTEGDAPAVFPETGGARLAPLICYEIIYPMHVRDAVAAGGEILVNASNYAWYPGTDQPEQIHQMAVFRAIETRRSVVVAANTGISGVVDPLGRTDYLARDGRTKDVAGFLGARVPLCDATPLAGRWGDLPAIVALAVVVVAALVPRVRRRRPPAEGRRP